MFARLPKALQRLRAAQHAAAVAAPPNLPVATEQPLGEALRKKCVAQVASQASSGLLLGLALGLPTYAFARLQQRRRPKLESKSLPRHCARSALTFARNGALNASVNCLVETLRETGVVTSPIAGSCLTGALLSAQEGPREMTTACLSSALFAWTMERLGREPPPVDAK